MVPVDSSSLCPHRLHCPTSSCLQSPVLQTIRTEMKVRSNSCWLFTSPVATIHDNMGTQVIQCPVHCHWRVSASVVTMILLQTPLPLPVIRRQTYQTQQLLWSHTDPEDDQIQLPAAISSHLCCVLWISSDKSLCSLFSSMIASLCFWMLKNESMKYGLSANFWQQLNEC